MAKITLKRSLVVDAGIAREPTAAQMDYGEVAINYSEEDPALFIKNSNNEIIRLAGIGAVGGGSEVIIQDTAPETDSLLEGTLWWDSDETSGQLFVLYNDPDDGFTWIEASPTSASNDGGARVEISDTAPPIADFEEGDLWFNSDDGRLYILYLSNNGVSTWIDASPDGGTGSGGAGITVSDTAPTDDVQGSLWWNTNDNTLYVWYVDASNDGQWVITVPQGEAATLQKVTDNGSNTTNNITLGGDKITLDATDGNAEFAGNILADGYITSKSIVGVETGDGNNAFSVYSTDQATNTALIKGDGSATFEGDITAKDRILSIDPAGGDRYVYEVYTGGTTAANRRLAIDNNGTIKLGGSNVDTAPNISLNAHGSASFAGDVQAGGNASSGNAIGTKLNSFGAVHATRSVGSEVLWQGNLVGQADTSLIHADGTAEFAGGVNVGTATSRLGNSWGYQIYGGVNANGFALYNSGIHNTPSAPYFLRCVVTGVGDTVFVRTDGSATFAGNIDITGQGGLAGYGWSIANNGGLANKTPGGTKISFTNDGSATFAGVVTTDDRFVCNAGGNKTNDSVAFLMYQEDATTDAVSITAGGSATFAGGVTSNQFFEVKTRTTNSAYEIFATSWNGGSGDTFTQTSSIAANGAAVFSTVNGASVILNLEPDDDNNYTTTTEEYTETESYTGPLGNTLEREVTKTRDIRTYNGPTLDVKAVIQELQQRVAARDAVIADFTSRLAALEANTLQPLYSTTADLPSASEHHGKTAHVHSEGALYFAHAGNWIKLQNA